MVSSKQMIVFVLPVIFSIVFGSAVMADTLQKPDRELNMWPMTFSGESSHGKPSHDSDIEIIGLSNHYTVLEPVQIQVKINDSSISCGDLYITIYTSGSADVVTQGGYFNQCVKDGKMFPNNDAFSKVIDSPGSYKIVADIVTTDLTNLSTTGTFTVK
ncbi:hypothetical protein [Nitrosopumilus sp. Nsub]|uniref:hypothetical protein n=1 Tax=Nitrosopumilus sp. Nsub TaxID=1776294 RepID=UPI000831E6A2|nr:hypothetical protein [Nitrosopumilus sp. Nsub]